MQKDLTQGSITKTLLLFAMPMIAGNLLQQFYNIADTLIVGRFLGAEALAAVGSSYTLMTFLTSILLGLSMGSGAVFSIYYGEKNEEKLKEQKMIETPIGETLYYDYYCYVKEHSVTEWNSQTMILYGENDNLCEYEYIKKFASHFNCDLKIMENGEHFFHLKNQLEFYQNWLEEKVK